MNASVLPTLSQISFFQWPRTAAPNPRLASPISATATTLVFTSAPLDENGVVIATAFLMGVKNINSFTETILVPTGRLNYDAQTVNYVVGDYLIGGTSTARAIIVRDTDNGATGSLDLVVLSGTFQNNELITTAAGGSATADGTLTTALSADGLTATGVIRGIDLMGLDWTADNGFGASHEQDSPVFCNITGVMEALKFAALQGTIATGGSGIIIGTDAAGTVTLSRSTGIGTSVGFLRWFAGNTAAEFSNDGAVWNRIDNITGSNLVVITAADTTPGNLQTKIQARGGLAESVGTPAGDERLLLDIDLTANTGNITAGLLATVISDVTATVTEINQVLDGVSANVTDTNLNTLTAGATSVADALHTHDNVLVQSYTAYETITNRDAVCLLPIEVERYAQLTAVNLALGNSNVRRRYAIRIIPTVTTSTLTTMQFMAAEAVNASTTLGNLTISIQPDVAGAPSGTAITDGTANVITQVTQRTWNTTLAARTATWAAPPTLTAGTTYWIVFEVAATDAVNFLNLGVNSTYDENYLTFTRLTFDLDAGTWGGSVTNATPFFWFDNQLKLLGMALARCDASFGGRTWSFIGFAEAGAAAQASVNVSTVFTSNLTGLTPGAYYYLSATAGAITTTSPGLTTLLLGVTPVQYQYRIGRAVNATSLKIEPGQKRAVILETTALTATTTRQYIFWFNPEIVRVSATGFDANDSASSAGIEKFSTGGSNARESVNMAYNLAANGTAAGNAANSLNTTTDSANNFLGVGSSYTDAGFTYTFTEANAANVVAILEAIQ